MGKSTQQEPEAAGHVTSTLRKQRGMNAGCCPPPSLYLYSPGSLQVPPTGGNTSQFRIQQARLSIPGALRTSLHSAKCTRGATFHPEKPAPQHIVCDEVSISQGCGEQHSGSKLLSQISLFMPVDKHIMLSPRVSVSHRREPHLTRHSRSTRCWTASAMGY